MVDKCDPGVHIGFCMDVYGETICADCPTLTECLEMKARDEAAAAEKRGAIEGE